MNLQRREEIRVIAECPNDRHWAQEMRRAVAELLAHIDALEQAAAERVIADGGRRPTSAPAVVVPDDDRPSREFLENYVEGFDPGERSAALFGWREGRRHLREHARAIPAGRVLGEGMVAVPVEEWRHIATLIIHLIGDEDALDKIDNLVDPIGKAREERHGNGWIGVMMEEAGIVSSPTEIDDFFVCPPDALRANQGGAEHGNG